MIVRNIRKDLMYKQDSSIEHIMMVNNTLNYTLDFENRIIYALVSNFENGIDVGYIVELMEPKGWSQETLYNGVKNLLNLEFIEDITSNANLEKIKLEFEEFKKSIVTY